jgi:hypothetical protein
MKRRKFLLVFALPFLSGCLEETYNRIFHPPGTRVVLLHAWEVEPGQDAEVIESDDGRIADIEPIQRLLQRVRAEEPADEFSDYAVSIWEYDNEDRAAARFAEAADAVNRLPQYSHPEASINGIYVRTDGTVVLVASESEG